jgi:hypothetical protein
MASPNDCPLWLSDDRGHCAQTDDYSLQYHPKVDNHPISHTHSRFEDEKFNMTAFLVIFIPMAVFLFGMVLLFVWWYRIRKVAAIPEPPAPDVEQQTGCQGDGGCPYRHPEPCHQHHHHPPRQTIQRY